MKNPDRAGEFWEGSSDDRTGTGRMAFSVCLRDWTDFGNVLRIPPPSAAQTYPDLRCPFCACAVLRMAVFGLCHLPGRPAAGVLPGSFDGRSGVGIDCGKMAPAGISGLLAVGFQDLAVNFEYFSKNF